MRTVLLVIAIATIGEVSAQPSAEMNAQFFYQCLNKGDSSKVRSMLSPEFKVVHYEDDTTFTFDLNGFMPICEKFSSGMFQEKFQINNCINTPTGAIIEVEFHFILNGKLDHCGRDILYMDSRGITEIHSYSEGCNTVIIGNPKNNEYLNEELNRLLDEWHQAAEYANFEDYFGFMANDFYYLGTDPSERWTKEQFANFCKPYFDKGEAWTFYASERNFYYSDDGQTIWFDEKLDTWMEGCRGSGVLVKTKLDNNNESTSWKLKHYNLTVTIENEKIKDFIKLRQE